jgi:hypothetical protein
LCDYQSHLFLDVTAQVPQLSEPAALQVGLIVSVIVFRAGKYRGRVSAVPPHPELRPAFSPGVWGKRVNGQQRFPFHPPLISLNMGQPTQSTASASTLTVRDNRTGKSYEIP